MAPYEYIEPDEVTYLGTKEADDHMGRMGLPVLRNPFYR